MTNPFSENGIIIPENLIKKDTDFETIMTACSNAKEEKILHKATSDFHTINICENSIGKFLKYGISYQAGIINTPIYKGNLPYLNYFLLAYILNKNIKKILLIGFGIGLLVRQMEELFPKLEKIDAVDIEENVLPIAKKYFDFKESEKFNFYLQDALVYLRNNKTKYDLIITDVAGNEGVDERFFEDDFFHNIKKSLKKNGLFAFNSCSNTDYDESKKSFFGFTIEKYKKHFKNFVVFDGKTSDLTYYETFFNIKERVMDITNAIFFASDKNIDEKIFSNIKNETIELFKKLDIKDITKYSNDFYKKYSN